MTEGESEGLDGIVKWALNELRDPKGEIESILRRVCLKTLKVADRKWNKPDAAATVWEWTVREHTSGTATLYCGDEHTCVQVVGGLAPTMKWIARMRNEQHTAAFRAPKGT